MDTVVQYDIEVIKEEVRQLLKKGLISRQQPIYSLFKYICDRDWESFELELENREFLLRDRIIDLLGREDWDQD
ncbi:DUF4327 family protein [Fortiea contorta]|uniref:DUF4327 family protein n=1 Tax=Fortiea contorta TaxID=1892405 RepID=UPI00034D18FC|nr:DUF4327 family protein [Fortiea contorta]